MPLHLATALLPTGWASDVRLHVASGIITSVEPGQPPAPGDERAAIGLPGLPNLHSHAFQRGMAGFAERRGPGQDSFWSWRETMYRFGLRMTPDDVEAIAAQLYCEMLEGGFTRVGEFHYLHHDPDGRPYADPAEMAVRIAAASAEAGIGLTLLPVFYAHGTFGGAPPGAGQRRFVSDLDTFAKLLAGSEGAIAGVAGAGLGVAPHSLRAVTRAELDAVVAMAAGRPVHIHVAEQVREVEQCLAWSGRRPVEWLLDAAPVGPDWCLVHATHMSDDEVARLARTGAVAGLCPITEANLGDGIFEAPGFLAAGGRFGIGSDSNIVLDAAGELRQLEYAQRLGRRERNVLAPPGGSTGHALFNAALTGGSAALGQVAAGLAPGAPADLVSLRADHPTLAGHRGDDILDSWIFASGRDLVDAVWVGGIRQVEGGRHRARDRIQARFVRVMERLAAG